MIKKKRETLKSLQKQIKWLQNDLRQQQQKWYANGYNDGRGYVAKSIRELLGLDPL